MSSLSINLETALRSQYPTFVSITNYGRGNHKSYDFQGYEDVNDLYNKVLKVSIAFPNATIDCTTTPQGLFAVDLVLADDRMLFDRIEQIITRVVLEMDTLE